MKVNLFKYVNWFEKQSLTKEFLIIRETLNTRDEFLSKQKKFFTAEKDKIYKELIKDLKYQVLLTNDKINENYIKLLDAEKVDGMTSLLEDKIEELQNLKGNLAYYEDYMQFKEENNLNNEEDLNSNKLYPLKIRESLHNENIAIKSKFTRLKNLFFKLIKNKTIDFDEITYKQLNHILNTNYDISYSEDMFKIMKAQAVLLEQKVM